MTVTAGVYRGAMADQHRNTFGPDSPTGGDSGRVGFGRFGETCAARWYEANGFNVLGRNWRSRRGELDLIVGQGSLVVFVEVKARASARFGTGFDAVDHRKQARVRAVAGDWLASSPGRFYDELRFDVVDVDRRGTVLVNENCF